MARTVVGRFRREPIAVGRVWDGMLRFGVQGLVFVFSGCVAVDVPEGTSSAGSDTTPDSPGTDSGDDTTAAPDDGTSSTPTPPPGSSSDTAPGTTGDESAESSGDEETSGEPAPDSVYFFSDWRTALGSSIDALLDDSWTDCYGSCSEGAEVLSTAAEGRDFPTDNFLRIDCAEVSTGWLSLLTQPGSNSVPEIEVGGSVFYRWYFRALTGDAISLATDPQFHGTEFWADTSRPFGANDRWGMTGWRWDLDISASPSGFEWPYGVGLLGEYDWNTITGPLDYDTVYRLEYGMRRISETEYEVEARIHDADGTMLFDTEDFTLAGWSSQPEVNLANDGPYISDGTEWTTVQEWRLGLNGCSAPFGWSYGEYAGAAICDDWCGPYPIPGVED